MSKKLKSFHKLFFIVFFSFLFSSIVGSGNTPDLPNRIAPELEKIEALPRRTKPAELNIEVTKIKSEPLEEVYIDRKNKNIYVDFSKKREQALKGVKDAKDLEKKYNLIVSESVQGDSEVNGRSKIKNKSNSQVMSYEVVEYQGKKVLKIPYENEPEKFYISVQENKKIKKIYIINKEKVQNINIKENFTYINPANRILIKESELKNDFNIDGTAKYPEKIYKFYSQEEIGMKLNNQLENLNLFPAIYLGDENNNGGYRIQNQKLPYRVKITGGGTGIITLAPNLPMSDFSYEHTVAAGSAPEKPAADTFYNAVGGGVVNATKNAIYAKIVFYVKGEYLEKLLKKSKESSGQIVQLPYLEKYKFSLSPGNYLNFGNNCYLPSLNIGPGDILESQLPPIEVEKSQESLNRKTLERKFQLNDLVIKDDDEIKSEYLFGYLENKQIGNYIEQGRPFPVIALGSELKINSSGWGWSSDGNPNNSFRENVVSEFKSKIGNLSVELYFKNIVSTPLIGKIERGSDEQINIIGSYSDGYSEQISGYLYAGFNSTQDLKEMITQARKIDLQEIIFKSEDNEQINFIMGQYLYIEGWNNYYYTIPASGKLTNLGEEKLYRYNYPNIRIIKELIEDNLTLNLKDGFDVKNLIKFSKDGVSQESVVLETSKNIYLKSLNYLSYVTFNSDNFLEIDYNGNTSEEVVTLKDISTNNQLKLSIRYELGYPILEIKEYDKKGEYILNIKHYDPSLPTKLKRRDYILKIIVENDKKLPEFKIDKNINEIIIRKENEKFIVEYPDNKVGVTQQTNDLTVFPVLALNSKEKWQINTPYPFNPIDKRPWSSFNIGENIKVSTSLKETPYQNINKFFIYNRGELGNRNIAVGGYSKKELEGNKNKVEIDFKIDFSQEDLEKIWNYSQKFSENKVLIPYSSIDDETHKIYAIKGVINNNQFEINPLNILEEIDFPKVYVLKGEDIKENTVILTFKNPIPKSGVNLKGSFDINSDGLKLPNNMPYTLEHPESLNINGITSEWQGYSKINKYHKIDIKVLRDGVTNFIKTITTNNEGTLKDDIQIQNGNKYSYILKKGKNSLIVIGLENWNLSTTDNYTETLILEHKNSDGRVTYRDKYKIVIEPFNILTYLALPNPIPIDKKLVKQIETGTQRVPLIDFQLRNYDKDLTIQNLDSDQGVRIELNSEEIELVDTINSMNKIKGKLNFVGDKNTIVSPNEIGNLEFNVSLGTIMSNRTYKYNGISPLVTINTYNFSKILIDKLEIKGTSIGSNLNFPYFNAKSNLKDIIINDNITVGSSGVDLSMGTVSLQQNGNAPSSNDIYTNYSFPTIALGDENGFGWGVNGGAITNEIVRKNVYTKYYFENKPTIEVMFRTFIGEYNFWNYRNPYIRKDQNNKVVIAGCYGWSGDVNEKVSSEIKVTLLSEILEKAREIKGNRIILKARLESNDNKIALVHSRIKNTNVNTLFLPTDNDNVYGSDKVRYFNYKDIIIEKDSFTKNLKLNFLKTYNENIEINFGKDSIITSDLNKKGVEVYFYEKGVLHGLGFKNKIRVSSLDETTLQGQVEYDIDNQGNLLTPIEIKMIKNGAEATLNLKYNNLNALLSIKDVKNTEDFNVVLDYIEPSGDIRRKYNLSILTNRENTIIDYKKGEMDLIISSRYNAADGQLNSSPLAITADGVKYQTEVLDLKLLNGDLPEAPKDKSVFIDELEIPKNTLNKVVTLENGKVILKVTRKENGDLEIKPVSWNYNAIVSFVLTYRDTTKNITNQYKFNVKCPEFFVASAGILDFGKLYKFGSPQDKTITTNIKLNYNTNVEATYTLDISQGDLNVEDEIFKNWLYLDDNKNLLVKNLSLGEEVGKGTTERNLPLTGTIHGPSVLKASEGKYEKTIQILIHLK